VLVLAVNVFHVAGILLAAWAVVLTAIGIMSHGFPSSKGQERATIAVSVLLVIGAIAAAIYTGATEEHEEGHEGEPAAFVLRI
jgi:hypothetical protein